MFYSSTVYNTLEKRYIDERERELKWQANITAGTTSDGNYLIDNSNHAMFDMKIQEASREAKGSRILIIDKNGVVVNDSSKAVNNSNDINKTFLIKEVTKALEGEEIATVQNNYIMYVAVPVLNKTSNEKIGAVFISASISDIYESLSDIKNQLMLLTILIIIILGVFVFFISGIIIEPIKGILKVIQKMSDGHLNQRIEVKGHNELYQLSVSFNNMAEKLEKVETTRQEFVSNVSHELKTPLSSIKVLSESLLLQESLPEEMYREFLHDINSEVDRMTAIINDLLQLVKLDRKQTAIVFKPVNINKCMEGIVKRLRPLANKKDITITYEKSKDIIADADEMKLSLALSNLVDNAIKYTPNDGHVIVVVTSDHQNVFIAVQDTGIGISEEDQSKVFDRFYRVDKTRDRETGGTGLGLAITHSTILLHNGSIKLTSCEGKGSVFSVRIPLKQSSN